MQIGCFRQDYNTVSTYLNTTDLLDQKRTRLWSCPASALGGIFSALDRGFTPRKSKAQNNKQRGAKRWRISPPRVRCHASHHLNLAS